MSYQDQLKAEADTWLIEDDVKRAEKARRERMRHYKLARDLLLDKLDTQSMNILEVGGGPLPLSDILPHAGRIVVDPLANEYRQYYPCLDHTPAMIEVWPSVGEYFELVICTNALDHVERPFVALNAMDENVRPGGFMAIMCAENNALTNPHPAHVHNLTADYVHSVLDYKYETVWELNYAEHGYRYGWVEYNGRRGQPAFALLMRKCAGYV